MIVFWVVMPFLFWLKPRWKAWRASKHIYEVLEYPEGPCCEGGDMCDGSCLTE